MQSLITDHIDIWASAQTRKANGNGRGNGTTNQNLYGIKKLRELILELAVRGKLVPQDPGDEPASILLEKIAAEKARLVKEGKIKKEKPLPQINEDEKLFELPKGWEYIRIGDAMNMVNGRAFKPSEWSSSGLEIIRIQNLNDSSASYNYCDFSVDSKFIVNNGDFLISWSGTPGTSFGAFIWDRGPAVLNQHIFRCELYGEGFFAFYLRLAINAELDEMVSRAHGGVGLQHITKGKLQSLLITLPPLAEQHCIVAKVDELMAICDQLEQQQTDSTALHQTLVETLLGTLTDAADHGELELAWQRIADHFDTLFITEHSIDQLKQTILQLAVMGKLVQQDPSDESVDQLLGRVLNERRIRKTTLSTEVQLLTSENSLIYLIPVSWRWQTLDDLLIFGPTNGFSPKAVEYETAVRSLTLSATTTGYFRDECSKFVEADIPLNSDLWLCDGDMLVQRGNAIEYVGVAAIYWGGANQFIYPDLMMKVRISAEINVRFVHLAMLSKPCRDYMRTRASGTSGSMPKINQGVLKGLPIPVPPIAEQDRIVAKVDELIAICDTLKARLKAAQTTQIQLADAIVEQAIGDNKCVTNH